MQMKGYQANLVRLDIWKLLKFTTLRENKSLQHLHLYDGWKAFKAYTLFHVHVNKPFVISN
ncbi:hypothetical protein Hanom_Chr08g00686001 [Helianthus anomalus]